MRVEGSSARRIGHQPFGAARWFQESDGRCRCPPHRSNELPGERRPERSLGPRLPVRPPVTPGTGYTAPSVDVGAGITHFFGLPELPGSACSGPRIWRGCSAANTALGRGAVGRNPQRCRSVRVRTVEPGHRGRFRGDSAGSAPRKGGPSGAPGRSRQRSSASAFHLRRNARWPDSVFSPSISPSPSVVASAARRTASGPPAPPGSRGSRPSPA